jgi:N-acetylmuramoyl-L-alanine amidase
MTGTKGPHSRQIASTMAGIIEIKNGMKPQVGRTSRAFIKAIVLPTVVSVLSVFTLLEKNVAAMAETDKPVVSGARVAGDADRTRFVLDMDSQVEPSISGLASPYRLIIDLPEVEFSIPEGTGENGRGLVRDWRYGLFAAGKSRIVMDLTGPVSVDNTFFLPAVDAQPARLVVDLVSATPSQFASFVKSSREAGQEIEKMNGTKSDRLVPPADDDKPLIVLDPGHGGIDTGATGVAGTLEKAIVLDFASLLKEKLDESGLYDVRLTRADDTFISLKRRVEIGHELEADLFISPIRFEEVASSREERRYTRFQTKHLISLPKIWQNLRICPT